MIKCIRFAGPRTVVVVDDERVIMSENYENCQFSISILGFADRVNLALVYNLSIEYPILVR